jgi:hypothetical protein
LKPLGRTDGLTCRRSDPADLPTNVVQLVVIRFHAGADAPLPEFGPSRYASVSERELTWWVCPLPTKKRHVRFERTGKLLPGVVPSFDMQLTNCLLAGSMADVAVARDWEPRTPQCVDDVVARQSRSPEFDQDTLQRCRSM